MAESLGSSVLDLSTDDTELIKGLENAEKETKSRTGRIGDLIGKAAKVSAAAFAAAGAAAVTAAFKTAAYGDEIAKTAPKLGVTTDHLQEMNFWAERNGISSSTLERAVGTLNTRVGQASEGIGKYAESFQNLGVEIRDANGEIRPTNEVLGDTIARLSEIEDPARQSAMAAEILGDRMARELMPALRDGTLSLEEAAEEAHRLGLVMDGDALAAAERFQDNWADIKDTVSAFVRQAAIPLMAILADRVFPAIREGIVFVRNLFDAFKEGGGVVDSVADFFAGDGLSKIFDTLLAARERMLTVALTVFNAILEGLVEIVGPLVETIVTDVIPTLIETLLSEIPALLDAAIRLFQTLIDAVFTILPTLVRTLFGELLPTVLTTVLDMIPDLLDTAVDLFLMLVEAVLDVLPELITVFVRDVFPAVITAILNALPDLLAAAFRLFGSLARALVETIPQLLGIIVKDLVPSVLKAILDIGPQLFQAGVQIIRSLIDGIKSMFGGVGEAIGGIASRIRSFLPFSPAKVGPLSGRGSPELAGRKIAEMVADGMSEGVPEVSATMNSMLSHSLAGLEASQQRSVTVNVQGELAGMIDEERIVTLLRRSEMMVRV